MSQEELLYRAYLEYRKASSTDAELQRFLEVVKTSNQENDTIILTKHKCNIDLDWVVAIEEGLVFIEKAIREERQFITSEGEVIEIEKVKSVSRETVEHLAKHSELITRVTDNEDLTPDKLYTVEKLTDYAIYENRFLYMVLCYLRDFISIRYDKIVEKVTTYVANTKMDKKVSFKKQKLEFNLTVNDLIVDDPIMIENNPSKDILRRVDILLQNVLLLLKTPLMVEVSKAPMLRPPVTKTNVLKMNKNFKGALALYEYVSAYTKDGYEIIEYKDIMNPFNPETSGDFAEIAALVSFLTYEHGNGLRKQYQKRYEELIEEERVKERIKFEEQVKKVQRQVLENKTGYEEYILLLEQRNRLLEKDSILLEESKKEILELTQEIKNLNNDLKQVDKLKEELETTRQDFINEITDLKVLHNEQITNINTEWTIKLEEVKENHKKQKLELEESYGNQINSLRNQISETNEAYAKKDSELREAQNSYQLAINERLVLLAELNGIRKRYNLPELNEDNFTSEDRFKELEEELKAFTKFFNDVWKKTKPKIKQRVFRDHPYVPKIKK